MAEQPKDIGAVVEGSPDNWGRWGDDDELGALNFLTAAEVLRGVGHVRSGKVFTLGIPIGSAGGDPVWPGRSGPIKMMTQDRSDYISGRVKAYPGDAEFADDWLGAFLQGSTQYDALAHMWFDNTLYNGHDAETTSGGLRKCGVDKIAERGVVGRGVLLDIPRSQGRERLDAGETIGVAELEAAASAQGVEVGPRDILLVRTGWLGVFYAEGPDAFYGQEPFLEPGMKYSPELAEWFHEKEIAALSTDTIANEVTVDPATGFVGTLHIALMVKLGIAFSELVRLDPLAADCAEDGQYDFLYAAAPMNVVEGAGAPVNPLAIK